FESENSDATLGEYNYKYKLCILIIALAHPLLCLTMGLIATTDVQNAIKNSPTISKIHHLALAKCTKLWNASNSRKTRIVLQFLEFIILNVQSYEMLAIVLKLKK
ncbi:unnamed protein product, partial [Gordionus sp. m RMFG-2023]